MLNMLLYLWREIFVYVCLTSWPLTESISSTLSSVLWKKHLTMCNPVIRTTSHMHCSPSNAWKSLRCSRNKKPCMFLLPTVAIGKCLKKPVSGNLDMFVKEILKFFLKILKNSFFLKCSQYWTETCSTPRTEKLNIIFENEVEDFSQVVAVLFSVNFLPYILYHMGCGQSHFFIFRDEGCWLSSWCSVNPLMPDLQDFLVGSVSFSQDNFKWFTFTFKPSESWNEVK